MALATKKQRPSTWNPDKSSRLFIVLPENKMQLQTIRTPRTPKTPRTPRTPRTPKVSANQSMTKRATFSGTVNIFTSQPPYLPIISEGSMEDGESWARSPMHQQMLSPRPPLPLPVETESPEDLPNFLSIPRPEELTRRPPYWLIVRQESRQKVTVDGSHAPSMKVLAEYLNKWCRAEITLRENRPMMVDIQLHDSPFGLGLLKDRLVLETTSGRELSAVLVLAFAEKALGYEMVDNGASGPNVWQFKRTRAFK